MADTLGVAKATISYKLNRVKPYDPELDQHAKDGGSYVKISDK